MLVLAALVAAGTGIDDPGLWTQFGPWGAALAVLAGAIVWLLRDRARLLTDIDERDARERALYDRIIAQGDHIAPVLVENTEALCRAIRTIDRLVDR